MARPVRIEFPGAVYHVTARGNERREIVRDEEDRKRFVETLGEMVERFGVRVHAYCLMPNHYHLVLETPLGNLSQAVGWLQVTHTVRFNRRWWRWRRSGQLFQGRFKAVLVEADEYAQWLVEYVHLNPVRPRRKGERMGRERRKELDRYEWSSHRDYAGLRKKSVEWLCMDWWGYWGRTKREAQEGYRERVAEFFEVGEVASPWERVRGGLVLGGEGLWKRAQRLVGAKRGQDELQWTQGMEQEKRRRRAERLAEGEREERIKIWLLARMGGERNAVVGRKFGYRDGSGVAYALRRLEAEARQNQVLAKKLKRLQDEFTVYRVDP